MADGHHDEAQSTGRCWRSRWRGDGDARRARTLNTPLYFQGDDRRGGGRRRSAADQRPDAAVPQADDAGADAARRAARRAAATTWTSPGSRATRCTSRSRTRSRTCRRPARATFTLIVDGASEYTKYDTQVVAAALHAGAERSDDLPAADHDGAADAGRRRRASAASCARTTSPRASWIWMRSGAGTTPTRPARRSRAC